MSEINIYNCGPTLSDFIHIGCYRIFVLSNIIHAHYKGNKITINHGTNIMDIDDNILSKIDHQIAEEYYNSFISEFKYLNLFVPNQLTVTTKDYDLCQKIIENFIYEKKAYITDTGIYLDVDNLSAYGSLSNIKVKKSMSNNNHVLDKKNQYDPSLWKFKDGESFSVKYRNKNGRPGWDVQCASNCIFKMGGKIDYQFAGFNDTTHYENVNAIIDSYKNCKSNSKWILVKYVLFNEETPHFYLKDYISNGYDRQTIKYMLYNIKYSTEFTLDCNYIKACISNINKINDFYYSLKQKKSILTNTNEDSKFNSINFNNFFKDIELNFENLRIPIIIGEIFKLINICNKTPNLSINVIDDIINKINYIDERLDFLYKEGDKKYEDYNTKRV